MRAFRESMDASRASRSLSHPWGLGGVGGCSPSSRGSSDRESTCMPSWWTSLRRLCKTVGRKFTRRKQHEINQQCGDGSKIAKKKTAASVKSPTGSEPTTYQTEGQDPNCRVRPFLYESHTLPYFLNSSTHSIPPTGLQVHCKHFCRLAGSIASNKTTAQDRLCSLGLLET